MVKLGLGENGKTRKECKKHVNCTKLEGNLKKVFRGNNNYPKIGGGGIYNLAKIWGISKLMLSHQKFWRMKIGKFGNRSNWRKFPRRLKNVRK